MSLRIISTTTIPKKEPKKELENLENLRITLE